MWRQGDVLLIETSAIPANATRVNPAGGRIVLAEGEQTGHAHTLAACDAELYETANAAERWLRVRAPESALTHQEHSTITLPAGDYRVIRQREYAPEAVRNVAD